MNQGTRLVRPVLKWAGGKSQLLPELVRRVPYDFVCYHEPFVGGGALFFELSRQGRLTHSYISDINETLIDVYLALRDDVDEVVALLREHRYERSYYYRVRALRPESLSLAARAARAIYLNRTCYNGLYRENRAGHFNVPFGRYTNPTICDEANLRAASEALRNAHISCRPFSSVLDFAHPGDFVYFDPPYHPLSPTSNFTSYDRNGFDRADQVELRGVLDELTRRHVKFMLSNSDTEFTRDLYRGYHLSTVSATRAINSKGDSRGKVTELIACNYEVEEMVQRALLERRGLYPGGDRGPLCHESTSVPCEDDAVSPADEAVRCRCGREPG